MIGSTTEVTCGQNISPGWPCLLALWWAVVGGARDGARRNLSGAYPFRGGRALAVVVPSDHGGRRTRPSLGHGPRPLLGPSPLISPRSPLLAAAIAGPAYCPYRPGHDWWLHGWAWEDESRVECAWDGPKRVFTEYRPPCVCLGAAAGPWLGQRCALAPSHSTICVFR